MRPKISISNDLRIGNPQALPRENPCDAAWQQMVALCDEDDLLVQKISRNNEEFVGRGRSGVLQEARRSLRLHRLSKEHDALQDKIAVQTVLLSVSRWRLQFPLAAAAGVLNAYAGADARLQHLPQGVQDWMAATLPNLWWWVPSRLPHHGVMGALAGLAATYVLIPYMMPQIHAYARLQCGVLIVTAVAAALSSLLHDDVAWSANPATVRPHGAMAAAHLVGGVRVGATLTARYCSNITTLSLVAGLARGRLRALGSLGTHWTRRAPSVCQEPVAPPSPPRACTSMQRGDPPNGLPKAPMIEGPRRLSEAPPAPPVRRRAHRRTPFAAIAEVVDAAGRLRDGVGVDCGAARLDPPAVKQMCDALVVMAEVQMASEIYAAVFRILGESAVQDAGQGVDCLRMWARQNKTLHSRVRSVLRLPSSVRVFAALKKASRQADIMN